MADYYKHFYQWNVSKIKSLNLTKYHALKTFPVLSYAPCHEVVMGEVEVQLYVFLTSALDGDGW
jgi:hypothetical protein